jgi:hypothetical protein
VDPDWIRIQWGPWIRILNPDPAKIAKKLVNFLFEVLDVLFFEG